MPENTQNDVGVIVTNLKKLFFRLRHGTGKDVSQSAKFDYMGRSLICTPYGGNYGEVAGWVIAVEGSPPKGTLVIDLHHLTCVPSKCTYIGVDGCKNITGKKIGVIKEFHLRFLASKNAVASVVDSNSGGFSVTYSEVKIG